MSCDWRFVQDGTEWDKWDGGAMFEAARTSQGIIYLFTKLNIIFKIKHLKFLAPQRPLSSRMDHVLSNLQL